MWQETGSCVDGCWVVEIYAISHSHTVLKIVVVFSRHLVGSVLSCHILRIYIATLILLCSTSLFKNIYI